MNVVEKEWIAIRYYTNPDYRNIFNKKLVRLKESKHVLRELTDKLKKWFDGAKEKAKSFLASVKSFAGEILPGSFVIGLSKLGDAGKKIWEFVSSLAGEAYQKLTGYVDQFKQWLESQKEQIVANVLNFLLKQIAKTNVSLYNKILNACNAAKINTGLGLMPEPQQPQQVKENVLGTSAAAVGAAQTLTGGNPRDILAGLVENALNTIQSVLTPDLKKILVETMFPVKAESSVAIGALITIPLAQQVGSLSFDTMVAFVSQIVATVKHLGAKAAGKISLFRETLVLEAKVNSFINLLVANFDSLKGAIVGLIKGSNVEAIIKAAGGDVGAGADVIKQLLKLLVGAVAKKAKEMGGKDLETEPAEELVDQAQELLISETIIQAKVSLVEILY